MSRNLYPYRDLQSCKGIDPLHVCGNAVHLEDKTKEIFASLKKVSLFIVLYSRLAAFPQTCKGSILKISKSGSENRRLYKVN